MFSFPLVAPNPRLDSARGEIKKSQKSGIFTEIKKPLKNGGLFSAFVYVYFTPESGTLSTAFLPFFIDRLDSAGIGPQTRIDGDVQGGNQSNENFETVFTRRRSALRDKRRARPRRDQMRGIEQQHDVYVR